MLKILFTGDVCFKVQHEMDENMAQSVLAECLPVFESADLRVMNLETPLAPEGMGEPIPKAGPNIIGRPQNLGFLKAAGCDCAALANNHTRDFGHEPLMNTIKLLDEAGIAHPGAGRDITEAYKAWRVVKNGVRLSIISVCENEFGIAERSLSGTAGYNLNRLAGQIREERLASDKVIVFCHGGNEYNPLPSPGCRDRYRLMTRLGADAVIAGHTHCPQGFEYYEGKPIVYSMGNFLFKYAGSMPKCWYYGYMTMMTIDDGGIKVEPIPYTFDEDGTKITLFSGEKLDTMLGYLKKLSAIIPDDDLMDNYYDGWCWIQRNFLKDLSVKDEYFDPDNGPVNCKALYNRLICEAHCELVGNMTKLIFYGKLRHAESWAAELEKLRIDTICDRLEA